MFESFAARRMPATAGTEIFLRIGGQGPPLLLLHGYPQTHAIWHRVAPALARALHRRLRRPARLRRQRQAGRRTRRTRPTPSAPWRRTWSRSMAALGFERFLARRPRPRRPGGAPPVPRPSRAGAARRRARHRADRTAVRAPPTGAGHRLLSLVLPDPARAPAGAADRRRPAVLPAPQARPVVGGQGHELARPGGAGRVRALLRRPGHDPCHLRGLSRRRHDRPRARRGRPGPADRLPAAGAVGRARR